MRRASFVMVALALTCAASCGDKKPATAVIVSISAEPKVPTEIDALQIKVTRGGTQAFSREYNLRAGEVLPGTLTVAPDEVDGAPVDVQIAARQGQGEWKLLRRAVVGFSREKTKLLRLPLRYSCNDIATPCRADETCVAGECKPAAADVETLPDADPDVPEVVRVPIAAASAPQSTCFSTPACLRTIATLPLPLFECGFPAPGPAGSFNVAMTWRATPGRPAVVEAGPEGFTIDRDRVVLAPGLCAAVTAGKAILVATSSDCPTKAPGTPVCGLDVAAPPACVPVPETCNGKDDDCDGVVDNDLSDTGAFCTSDGKGACSQGHIVCEGGVLLCRAIPAGVEGCGDGRDDNCDGRVDEGCACVGSAPCYSGAPGTAGRGACTAGVLSCKDGRVDSCVGEVVPKKETCGNGIDDDCNGMTDEGCPSGCKAPEDCPAAASECVVRSCDAGVCGQKPAATGAACATGGACDGKGGCVTGCKSPTECPGVDTACATRTCQGGTCGIANQAKDVVVAQQTKGDCKASVCDGAGNVMTKDDATDLPVDGVECTDDVCTAGVPSNPATASGKTCATGTCDGAGACKAVVVGSQSCQGMTGTECFGESCCASLDVPGGVFSMGRSQSGSDASALGIANELPEHPVTLTGFALDKFEVTVARFRRFVQGYDAWRAAGNPKVASGANPNVPGTGWNVAWTSSLPTTAALLTTNVTGCAGASYTSTAGPQDTWPMNCVNWYEGFAFAIWDGGRLPTEAEWEYAAAGGAENRLFPWGAAPLDTKLANYGAAEAVPGVPVGSKPAGAGKFGHRDLAGSLWELPFDAHDNAWYSGAGASCTDCANTSTSSLRVQRGGAYLGDAYSLRAAYRDDGIDASYRGPEVGIRTARAAAACSTPAACPGKDDECVTRTCAKNACALSYSTAGTKCIAGTCDGFGACVMPQVAACTSGVLAPGAGLCKGTPTALAWGSTTLTIAPTEGGLKATGMGWNQLAEDHTTWAPLTNQDFCFSFHASLTGGYNQIMAGVRVQPSAGAGGGGPGGQWTGSYLDRGIYLDPTGPCFFFSAKDVWSQNKCTAVSVVHQDGECALIEVRRKGNLLEVGINGVVQTTETLPDELWATTLLYNDQVTVKSSYRWQ
jgi:formylglycine-generating enzyme required for sulfatase activity